MDPITVGIVVGALASSAAAALGWRGRTRRTRSSERPPIDDRARAGIEVGNVLSHLDDEYWLAGELTIVREGSPALRLFVAPERGRARWVALLRTSETVWILAEDAALATLGWPGIEIAHGERLFRRGEFGNASISAVGEQVDGWEGPGRYCILRARDAVAVILEVRGALRLALVGREVPRELVQTMG